jgi:low temperature requirement protein LtrA
MPADQAKGTSPAAGGAWYRPMTARPPDEPHRTSTVLELFFDLCFVVAVAQAGATLHHQVAAGQAADGVVGFASVFFAIWWAWMNFTWFASAYDTDDIAYRVTTLLQIAGALILAAGGLLTAVTAGSLVAVRSAGR